MHKLIFCLSALLLLASCKKEKMMMDATQPYSEAAYQATITGKWNSTDFNVPAGVHFTALAGAVHNKAASLWMAGSPASRSLQYVAENGYATPLLTDVDTLICQGKALARLSAAAPPPTGYRTLTFSANTNFPLLSFASMLAPTPDWFTGVHDLALYRQGAWVKDTTIQLYGYDAGTKDGDVFSYNQPATSPKQNIQRLDFSNASVLFKGLVLPIAELRLQKME